MKNRTVGYIAIASVLLLLVGELYLRQVWGFCDAVLVQSDPEFEYLAQPNQDSYRFKRHIVYNNYSQRNGAVDSSAVIILGLGDSVINGGTLTDQDSLATTQLSNALSLSNRRVQVLNISAGSWGPDNCMAYLNRYGTFGAVAAFLVCSSHDVYDTMDFTPVVDQDVSFPSKQYALAWYELLDRYLLPRYVYPYLRRADAGLSPIACIHKTGQVFNPGFQSLVDYFRSQGLPFFILLHAETAEQNAHSYNKEGMQIIDFCRTQQIPMIKDLDQMSPTDYRDNIHLNESGQRKLYGLLKTELMRHSISSLEL